MVIVPSVRVWIYLRRNRSLDPLNLLNLSFKFSQTLLAFNAHTILLWRPDLTTFMIYDRTTLFTFFHWSWNISLKWDLGNLPSANSNLLFPRKPILIDRLHRVLLSDLVTWSEMRELHGVYVGCKNKGWLWSRGGIWNCRCCMCFFSSFTGVSISDWHFLL